MHVQVYFKLIIILFACTVPIFTARKREIVVGRSILQASSLNTDVHFGTLLNVVGRRWHTGVHLGSGLQLLPGSVTKDKKKRRCSLPPRVLFLPL